MGQTRKCVDIGLNTISHFFEDFRIKVMNYLINHPIEFELGSEYEVDEFLVKNVADGWHKCCWVAGIVERGTSK